MKHHLALTQYAILGTLGLFFIFAMFFSMDSELAGKATTGTTVNISESTPMNCTFTLASGYNIISIPCLSTAEPIENITHSMSVNLMYQYVPGGTDRWRVYNPDLPSYVVSDLQFLTRRAGYIVFADANGSKTIEGRRVGLTDIPITTGWNLVGYPTFNITSVADALADINDSYNVVVTYNASAAQFVNYTNPDGGDLLVLTPGEGYWINGTALDTWAVNT